MVRIELTPWQPVRAAQLIGVAALAAILAILVLGDDSGWTPVVDGANLAFSDLCETKNAAGKDLLEIASDYQLCGAAAAGLLFDCDPAYIPGPEAWDIINFASTTVLESTLQCATGGPTVDRVDDTYPKAHNYEEAL